MTNSQPPLDNSTQQEITRKILLDVITLLLERPGALNGHAAATLLLAGVRLLPTDNEQPIATLPSMSWGADEELRTRFREARQRC
ncbi:hypothetical protein [Paracoccus fontiphilus]|uniref:Uncharacterized protein n=1 Tax=Paracoccus fontiphilus TaxID=1815556 RepID=A0ABV7ILF0_9RHOB|nr:hypothetical protein [Paracoccus fontiphilus]